MTSAEEIRGLKRARRNLEQRLEKIEKSQRAAVVRLSGQLGEIIEGIASAQEKEKSMPNATFSKRVRLAKKGMLLGKELSHFEIEVVSEFDKHNISEESGKKLISITKLIRDNNMQAAKERLKYFEEIAALSKEYETIEGEIEKKDRLLKREQLRIEKILEEMAWLEKETIDMEKVRRHEELLKNLEKLKGLRAAHMRSLISKPVAELLGEAELQPLKGQYAVFREKEDIAQLRQFFSDYPVFGKCNASQICESFEWSEKRLSHVCPETSRFKKVVLGNRNLFETLGALEHTEFLAVDIENEKVLDFYARDVEGAREAIERIRQLKKGGNSDREEYEKSRRMEGRREELAGYSRTALDAELKNIRSLLEILHSEVPEGNAEENRGGFPGIGTFIKKLAGKP